MLIYKVEGNSFSLPPSLLSSYLPLLYPSLLSLYLPYLISISLSPFNISFVFPLASFLFASFLYIFLLFSLPFPSLPPSTPSFLPYSLPPSLISLYLPSFLPTSRLDTSRLDFLLYLLLPLPYFLLSFVPYFLRSFVPPPLISPSSEFHSYLYIFAFFGFHSILTVILHFLPYYHHSSFICTKFLFYFSTLNCYLHHYSLL